MNRFISKNALESLREQYPEGTRVELVKMDDPQAPPVGTMGTVTGVDDIGSVMIRWDNGCGLSAAWGADIIRRADEGSRTVSFDPSDLDAMRQLMRDHDAYSSILAGENELGESITIDIGPDKITTVTLQNNGWVRRNIYHYDGTREELFDGRVQ